VRASNVEMLEAKKDGTEMEKSMDAQLKTNWRVDVFQGAQLLFKYLCDAHWDGAALVGPDSGVRFNARFGRFAKSYISSAGGRHFKDNYTYEQSMGYWIRSCWILDVIDPTFGSRSIALAATEGILRRQQAAGFWVYPNPEWDDRIATVEGNFAALGLLESVEHTGNKEYLNAAALWIEYMFEEIGFHEFDNQIAVNYFSSHPTAAVPNNTTLTLTLLAKFAAVSHDHSYAGFAERMISWLESIQLESGEFPYSVSTDERQGRLHYLCYQYNAFEFLDLAEYYALTEDQRVLKILKKLAHFLATGLLESGSSRHACDQKNPQVLYYTAVLGTALNEATRMKLGSFQSKGRTAISNVLLQQKPSGGFAFHSKNNYAILKDSRSYPRNLAMILYHLLLETQHSDPSQRMRETNE
jgi:hypothetical protein